MGGVAKRYRALVRRVPVQIEANPEMQYSTLEWSLVGNIMVVCIRPERVPDDTWARYLKSLRERPATKFLGVTIGTADVTSVQRKEMFEIVKAKSMQSAVVTDERLVRGIVTAASWFGIDVKAFSWAELPAAVLHLGTSRTVVEHVVQEVNRLKGTCLKPIVSTRTG